MTDLVKFSNCDDILLLDDGKEHTYLSILSKPDEWWEGCWGHIQWLFPTNKPSQYNSRAPILTQDEAKNFNKHNLGLAVQRFYLFLQRTNGLHEPSHNDLRVTRMIESCNLILGRNEQQNHTFAFGQFLSLSGKRMIDSKDKAVDFWLDAFFDYDWNK